MKKQAFSVKPKPNLPLSITHHLGQGLSDGLKGEGGSGGLAPGYDIENIAPDNLVRLGWVRLGLLKT